MEGLEKVKGSRRVQGTGLQRIWPGVRGAMGLGPWRVHEGPRGGPRKIWERSRGLAKGREEWESPQRVREGSKLLSAEGSQRVHRRVRRVWRRVRRDSGKGQRMLLRKINRMVTLDARSKLLHKILYFAHLMVLYRSQLELPLICDTCVWILDGSLDSSP